MQTISTNRVFGGVQGVYEHASVSTSTPMRFSVFVPEGGGTKHAVLYLSGLTCTEQNFTTKAGAQRVAAELGLVVIACDTSPRGDAVPDDNAYDLGQGAGFYVDATEVPFSRHFHMYRYVTDELLEVVRKNFDVKDEFGVFGHSMGGHGALITGLKNPDRFKSVSAFAPICHPSACPWGQKAFSAYLGEDRTAWRAYDACALVEDGHRTSQILIDQGLADQFLGAGQLLPEDFEAACTAATQPLVLRRHEGYDHSYYFMATFMADHLAHHAKILGALG